MSPNFPERCISRLVIHIVVVVVVVVVVVIVMVIVITITITVGIVIEMGHLLSICGRNSRPIKARYLAASGIPVHVNDIVKYIVIQYSL